MGALEPRLFQQLLVESVILSSAGTLAACHRSWCAEFLSSIRIGRTCRFVRDPGGARVVIFALGVGLASAFISVPFRVALLTQRSEFFAEGFGAAERPQKTWGRQILVGAQGCRDFADVVFSGLFVKTFGSPPCGILDFVWTMCWTMAFNPSMPDTIAKRPAPFTRNSSERVRAMPGVRSAASLRISRSVS